MVSITEKIHSMQARDDTLLELIMNFTAKKGVFL